MKNLFFASLIALAVLSGCSDKCSDVTCNNGGVCVEGTCACPNDYEGPNCDTEINEKFLGDYDTDYTGSGAFASTNGTTVASVTKGDYGNKILIDVTLDLVANVLGSDQALPIEVSVQADIIDNTYYIPETTVMANVGGAIDVEITFEIEGTLDGDDLNSILDVRGFLTGRVEMEGNK